MSLAKDLSITPRSGAEAGRTPCPRGGSQEELPHIRGQGQEPRVPGCVKILGEPDKAPALKELAFFWKRGSQQGTIGMCRSSRLDVTEIPRLSEVLFVLAEVPCSDKGPSSSSAGGKGWKHTGRVRKRTREMGQRREETEEEAGLP